MGAKYVPPTLAAVALRDALGGLDLVFLFAVFIGLVAGCLWRLGDAKKKGEAWAELFDDLTVSALTGLANFIIAVLAAVMAEKVHGGGPVWAAGMGMFVGAKGTDAMAWAHDKFFKEKDE